jgi:hypothetical protein
MPRKQGAAYGGNPLEYPTNPETQCKVIVLSLLVAVPSWVALSKLQGLSAEVDGIQTSLAACTTCLQAMSCHPSLKS